MKRNLFEPTGLRLLTRTVLAVPAAALMLGHTQAGTSIGINFYGNFFGSYYGGRAVSATAFGVDPVNWYTTPSLFDYAGAASNSISTGPAGVLSLAWAAPFTGINRVDPTNTPALTRGDSDVYYGFLDGGDPSYDSGYSVSLSGLATMFPSGYVVQAMASADSASAFVANTVSDGMRTAQLANPVAGRTTAGGAYALGLGSGVFTGDALGLSAPAAVPPMRSTLAGFLVTDQPVVSARPAGGGTFSSGDSLLLQAGAVGIPPLAYQWRLNGSPIPGATIARYSVAGVGPGDAGDYDLVVTNVYGGATSVVASVQIIASPVILRDLSSQTNYRSMMANLSVDAGGAPPLSYQWIKAGTPILNGTNAVLTLANLQSADAADYQVIVTNSLGTVTSAVASVAVLTNLPPYEGFNYPEGSLTGSGSDPAWGGPWAQTVGGYQGDQGVFTPGASYRDGTNRLLVSGGAVQLAAAGDPDYENIRNLLATLGGPAGGTVYFSFIGQITNTPWAGVELAQDGLGQILLGANFYAENWGWGDRSNTNARCGHSSTPSDSLALLVYRFDFTPTNTLINLYVNPVLGAEPATASVSGSWSNFQFNQVRLVAHGQYGSGIGPNGLIDELRLGGTWASVTPAALQIVAGPSLIWNYGILQSSGTLGASALWTNVPNATSPYPVQTTSSKMFYRVAGP